MERKVLELVTLGGMVVRWEGQNIFLPNLVVTTDETGCAGYYS